MRIAGYDVDNKVVYGVGGVVGVVLVNALRGKKDEPPPVDAILRPAEGLDWQDVISDPDSRGTIGNVGSSPGPPGPAGPPGPPGPGNQPNPSCRKRDQNCGNSRDCCGDLRCRNGKCVKPPGNDKPRPDGGNGNGNGGGRNPDRPGGNRPGDGGKDDDGNECRREDERCQNPRDCCGGMECRGGRCSKRDRSPERDHRDRDEKRNTNRDDDPRADDPKRRRQRDEGRNRLTFDADRYRDRARNRNDNRGKPTRGQSSVSEERGDTSIYVYNRNERIPANVQYGRGGDGAVNSNPNPGGIIGGFFPEPVPMTGRDYDTVRDGDTLKSLAERNFGNARFWQRVASLNNMRADSRLQVGTRVKIG